MALFAPPPLKPPTGSAATAPRKRWLLGDPGLPTHPDDVRFMQQDLARQGYDPQGIDGDFGPNTKQALQNWQQRSKATPPASGAPVQTGGPRENASAAPVLQAPRMAVPTSAPFVPPTVLADKAAAPAVAAALSAPAAKPAAPAVAAPAAGVGGTAITPPPVGLFRQALNKVGSVDPESAVNAGLGIAGAISYLTAKAPTLPAPQAFAPQLRPVQGLDEATQAERKSDITAAERTAGEALGTDVQGQQLARAGAAQMGLKARREVTMDNAKFLREDQNRLGQEQMRVAEVNSNRTDEFRKQTFELQNRKYEAQRATGAAMAQGALTYGQQKRAGDRQEAEKQLDATNKKSLAELKGLYPIAKDSSRTPAERAEAQAKIDKILAEEKRQQATRKQNGGVLRQYGSGGKLRKRKLPAVVAGLDTSAHDLTQRTLTTELARSSAKLLRDLLKLKTRPLK